MLVKTFISHIKHKSLPIQFVDKNFDSLYFDGTIGEYQTSLARDNCDNLQIRDIYPGLVGDELVIIVNDNKIQNSSAYGKCKDVIK